MFFEGLGVLISFVMGLVGMVVGIIVGVDFFLFFGLFVGLGVEVFDIVVLVVGVIVVVVGLVFITGCCVEVFIIWWMNVCLKVVSFLIFFSFLLVRVKLL